MRKLIDFETALFLSAFIFVLIAAIGAGSFIIWLLMLVIRKIQG